MTTQLCSNSGWIPKQYIYRAAEAEKIFSVTGQPLTKTAAQIALAELGQIVFFVAQTIIYALAFFGIVPTPIAGIVSLLILPLEAICSYNTFVHYKSFSRCILTAAAVLTLGACAVSVLLGFISDSAITLGAGGIALHIFRNISEYIDAKKSQNNLEYQQEVLKNTKI
jgi:hypothetical protein